MIVTWDGAQVGRCLHLELEMPKTSRIRHRSKWGQFVADREIDFGVSDAGHREMPAFWVHLDSQWGGDLHDRAVWLAVDVRIGPWVENLNPLSVGLFPVNFDGGLTLENEGVLNKVTVVGSRTKMSFFSPGLTFEKTTPFQRVVFDQTAARHVEQVMCEIVPLLSTVTETLEPLKLAVTRRRRPALSWLKNIRIGCPLRIRESAPVDDDFCRLLKQLFIRK